MRTYPLWMYNAAEEMILVNSAEHEKSLPSGWADSPGAALELARAAQAPQDLEPQPPKKSAPKTKRVQT